MTHMVRYTVKPDQIENNEALLRELFAELAETQPPGLHFEAFKLADDGTFIHLISHDKAAGHLKRPEKLGEFHAGLRERSDGDPLRTELAEIGSYRSPGVS